MKATPTKQSRTHDPATPKARVVAAPPQRRANNPLAGLRLSDIPTTAPGTPVVQQKADSNSVRNGMPAGLRSHFEGKSGVDLSDVQVHRNSAEPARVGALAFTQGDQIHLGPGQGKHLAHEAWHVVQQKQGRVNPTGSVAGRPLNDSPSLEREADAHALQATAIKD